MCATKVKVILKKGKDAQSSAVVGFCDRCNKEHIIDIGDIQNGVNIIKAFGLKQETKTSSNGITTYTYG
jgi:hypothetical protein